MKDEKAWDYSLCQIGNPCTNCINTCSFKIKDLQSRKIDQDEKEKENERIFKRNEE